MKKTLRDGLVLRSLSEGHASDRADLPQFYYDVFGAEGEEDADVLAPWTEDLMSEAHPTMSGDNFWVVVDPAQDDRIVSALMLIPQTWRYGHIEIPVGRPELVATHKDYRRRGLIRALMDAAHERSAELGHLVQGITGIGHYYRQFGYAMAVDLGSRARLPFASVPPLKDDQQPQYTLREATEADIPKLIKWDAYLGGACLMSTVRDAAQWRFELMGRQPNTPVSLFVRVIVDADGRDVGYVAFRAPEHLAFFGVMAYVVGPETSYLDTYDDVLRGMKAFAEEHYADNDENRPANLYFDSGLPAALDTLVERTLLGQIRHKVYAWYLRVPDTGAFIKHIAPVLEERLAGSGANRYTGTLKIGFYDLNGLTITFEDGCIKDAVQGEMVSGDDIGLPYHSFLNLMFGHRTLRELEVALPEVFPSRKTAVLLDALFPVQRSWLMALA